MSDTLAEPSVGEQAIQRQVQQQQQQRRATVDVVLVQHASAQVGAQIIAFTSAFAADIAAGLMSDAEEM